MDKVAGRRDYVEEGKSLVMNSSRRHAVRPPLSVADFINSPKADSVLENPYILLSAKKISTIRDLLHVLEQVSEAGKTVLIMPKM